MNINSHHQSRRILIAVAAVAMVIVASIFCTYSPLSLRTLDVKSEDLKVKQVYLGYNELVNMPRSTVHADLFCYGSLVESGYWTGVRLGLVIEKAGVSPQEGTIEFYATDGYSTKLDLSAAMREDMIIAYEKDGSPLSEITRLVIPDENGAEWISMINQIKIVTSDYRIEIDISNH